jgi:Sigma-70, region 4
MNNLTQIQELNKITLDVLIEDNRFSVRAYNVCVKNGLNNLNLILAYFAQHENFLKLANIGAKTNGELCDFCSETLENQSIHNLFKTEKEETKTIAELLSPLQTKVINQIVNRELNKLTQRAINVLSDRFGENLDFAVLSKTFSDRSNIKKLKLIGKKTDEELTIFIDGLESIASSLLELEENQILTYQILEKLAVSFQLKPEEIERFRYHLVKGNFPVFNFIYWLSIENKLLDERDMTILKNRLGYFLNEEVLTFDELGDRFGITRERMRQISVRTEKYLSEKLICLNDIKAELIPFLHYPIDFTKDVIHLPLNVVAGINEKENCHFSSKFIIKIFGHIYFDLYSFVGSDLKNFNTIYLVNNNLTHQFDFNSFFNALEAQLDENIEDDFSIDFEGYLLSFFFNKEGFVLLPRIRNVCEHLISSEYTEGVEIDWSGNLVFKRNTQIKVYHLVEDILEDEGKPLKIQDIHRILIERHPKFADKEIEVLRSQIGKEKHTFIYFGRTSTYGLAKWENEREDVKGGTIRDMTEEYLKQFNEPKHILEITEFVLKYRPDTNPNSVNGNMQANRDRFKEMGNGFWGLPLKNYDDFVSNKVPKFLSKYIAEFHEESPNTLENILIERFAEFYNLKNIQVKYHIQKSLEEGKLKRENGLLTYAKNSVYS